MDLGLALIGLAIYALVLAFGGLIAERHPSWCDRAADAVFGTSDEEQIP